MKNKHLVLLFLAALVIGWLIGQLPWTGKTDLPELDLLRLDTHLLTDIRISGPGVTERVLSRTEDAWILSQEGESVLMPPGMMAELLQMVHPLSAARIVRTQRPDTLGLGTSEGLWVYFRMAPGRQDSIRLGRAEDQVTWIALPGHEGIYQVQKDLGLFRTLDIALFQPGDLLDLDTSGIEACVVSAPASGISDLWRFSDSLQCWKAESSSRTLSPDSMANWLAMLPLLNRSETTRFFDESRRRERYRGMVGLHGSFGALSLRFYELPYPDLPEELQALTTRPALKPCYIVESSQKPYAYYAVYDTQLVHQIFHYLSPAPAAAR